MTTPRPEKRVPRYSAASTAGTAARITSRAWLSARRDARSSKTRTRAPESGRLAGQMFDPLFAEHATCSDQRHDAVVSKWAPFNEPNLTGPGGEPFPRPLRAVSFSTAKRSSGCASSAPSRRSKRFGRESSTCSQKPRMRRPSCCGRMPAGGATLAGQYATIEAEIDGVRVRRGYSISSAPTSRLLSITVKRLLGGRVSGWLQDNVKPGDVLTLQPPPAARPPRQLPRQRGPQPLQRRPPWSPNSAGKPRLDAGGFATRRDRSGRLGDGGRRRSPSPQLARDSRCRRERGQALKFPSEEARGRRNGSTLPMRERIYAAAPSDQTAARNVLIAELPDDPSAHGRRARGAGTNDPEPRAPRLTPNPRPRRSWLLLVVSV